ncbi:hypothetical protein FHS29_004595 [Saccharothrix tamanrassetensis]|uniref:Phosphodiesterase n=1 Tax=Saccharothrix tamanrassetensis TaxID=1051531 RepID=A0A841CPI5_9PSEU|nr:phosphodiesterase [Saccharothrix tamanrassetensis]MBB5957987.1 hypothetical protein [Saccharothrix tamanrassetensis]
MTGRPVSSGLTRAVTTVVGWGAALRGARLFHPRGVVFDAVFAVAGTQRYGVPLLDEPGEHPAQVRLSKAIPTPGGLPDVLGLAVRIDDAGGPGAPLDLALATTGSRPVLRHLLTPRRDFATTYTSLLPYRVGDRRRILAAVPADPHRRVPVDLAVLAARRTFRIMVAEPTGPWQPVATLTLGGPRRDAADPSFDVVAHALDRFRPCGRLNRLRGPAYRASQRARGAPGNDV